MKRIIPFITPFITGLFGGWVVECFLCFSSIMTSPFAGSEKSRFLVFLGICILLSASIIIAVVIVNAGFLIELNNTKRIRFFVIAQACVAILLFAISWSYADRLMNIFYNFF